MADSLARGPEQSLLGCCLLAPRDGLLLDSVKPDDFADPAHRTIWEALRNLKAQGRPIDAVTLSQYLGAAGELAQVGGVSYLAVLAGAVPTTANGQEYARLVREAAYRRRVAAAGRLLEAHAEAAGDDLPTRVLPLLRQLQDDLPAEADHSVSLLDLMTGNLPERRDLVGPLLPQGGFLLLAGPPKSAKTLLAMTVALNVARGQPFLEEWETAQGGVFYVLAEGGPQLVRDRFRIMLGQEPPPDNVYFDWPGNGQNYRLDDPGGIASLVRACKRRRVSLLIVDPLCKLHGLDENRTSDMVAVVRAIAQVREQAQVGVLAVHHSRKAGPASVTGSAQEMRGSSVLHGEADGVLMMTPRRSSADIRVDLELRWASEPPPFLLRLDPNGLRFEVVGSLDGSKRKLSALRLRGFLAETGPATVSRLAEATGCGERTIKRYLLELEHEGAAVARVGPRGVKTWALQPDKELFDED